MSTLSLRRLRTIDPNFDAEFSQLLAWEAVSDTAVQTAVESILRDVRLRGDIALLEYSQRFDRLTISDAAALELPQARLQQALSNISNEARSALEQAADRIRRYHEKQKQDSWQYREADGTILGQKITPLQRVGIYVPGGKASYPSSVLMNALPAKVAGVNEIIMVVPTPDGIINEWVFAAAAIAGVDRVFTVGGAQAIAALAYGTVLIPKVDKIVGPGNIYVATAKRMVFGAVGLDMVAGPSEILIICDGKTDPDWIAMDLFAQAEHDEDAQSILISPDAAFLDAVENSIARLLPEMERKDTIAASLANRGALIQARDMDEATAVSNRMAPEHLELSVENPEELLPAIEHAGAIFMGRHTPEALGDYCAGPNHVLPTSGTARFSSPLGVYDFQKRSSLIYCSAQGAQPLAQIAATLARGETLTAHARSAEMRMGEKARAKE